MPKDITLIWGAIASIGMIWAVVSITRESIRKENE